MLERGCKDFVGGRGFVLELDKGGGGGKVAQTQNMLKAGVY